MSNNTTDAEARAALEAVERSRRQVIAEIDMPRWYWWGLALGWIGLGVVTDLRNPWLTTAATVAFGAVHATVSQRVLGGRHRTNQLSVHPDVAGRHAPSVMIAALLGLAVVTIAGAIAASADGARHPVTIASIVVAALILLGGPRVTAAIRSRAVRASTLP